MSGRPEVIQRTLLQNPRSQNALPDRVIYNTLELATARVDGFADLFLFQRVSPSRETYGEIRENGGKCQELEYSFNMTVLSM
jgi:hypothetical protein